MVAGARPESAFDTPPLLRVALDRDFFPFQFFGGRARDHVTCDDPERLHKEGHNPTDHEGVSQHICCRPLRRRCHHNVATSAERKTHRAPNHVRICDAIKIFYLDLLEASHRTVNEVEYHSTFKKGDRATIWATRLALQRKYVKDLHPPSRRKAD